MKIRKHNNKGFSLVELIVIIAIISLAAGGAALSVSLVVGAEAKKAVQKIEASLDEVKTGSMSRASETLTIKYLTEGSMDNIDSDGFYAVESIYTISKAAGTNLVENRSMGEEHRRLCDRRVTMTLKYIDDSGAEQTETLSDAGTNSFMFEYDRATGLFKGIPAYDAGLAAVYPAEAVRYTRPVSLECTSGMRTYKIDFIAETGKHVRAD